MSKRYKLSLITCLILILLFAGTLGVSARRSQTTAASPGAAVSGGAKLSGKANAPHIVDMQAVPKAVSKPLVSKGHDIPAHLGVSASAFAQKKAAVLHTLSAPTAQPMAAPAQKTASSAFTPSPISTVAGMANSSSICPYFGGCEPPDQALGVSYSWIVQAVNTSVAVYSLSGALQAGWPKTAQSFFGIPSPGACDPNGPFLSDPRAFYDPNDNRLWVAILQIEGEPVGNNCPFQSTYWVAVTQNGNATGKWNVYSFDMALGSGNWADYTQFGFDTQAIYFSGNMYNAAGTAYEYAEYFGVRKHAMENGQAVNYYGFLNPTINGTSVDTVQPVLAESLGVGGPLGGQFIASEDINFGGGGCVSGCSGVLLISMSNPGLSTTTTSALFVSTSSYVLPPNADEPGCSACIDTNDTRIDGTPTWQRGIITFGLNTAVNNGAQVVPGIFWGQITVSLNDTGAITGASVYQSGYYDYTGDTAASFGALATDSDGDLYMVLEFMSSSINPSVVYTARRSTYSPGHFHDGGIYLMQGTAQYTYGSRWGDFEAVSPSGVPFTNEVWFSGQYSNSSGTWGTEIGHAKFVAGAS